MPVIGGVSIGWQDVAIVLILVAVAALLSRIKK